jgi:hypothetical protein
MVGVPPKVWVASFEVVGVKELDEAAFPRLILSRSD